MDRRGRPPHGGGPRRGRTGSAVPWGRTRYWRALGSATARPPNQLRRTPPPRPLLQRERAAAQPAAARHARDEHGAARRKPAREPARRRGSRTRRPERRAAEPRAVRPPRAAGGARPRLGEVGPVVARERERRRRNQLESEQG